MFSYPLRSMRLFVAMLISLPGHRDGVTLWQLFKDIPIDVSIWSHWQ